MVIRHFTTFSKLCVWAISTLGLVFAWKSRSGVQTLSGDASVSLSGNAEPNWFVGAMTLLALLQLISYAQTRQNTKLASGALACLGLWVLQDSPTIPLSSELHLAIAPQAQQLIFSGVMVGVIWWLAEKDRRNERLALEAQSSQIQHLRQALEKIQSSESALEAKIFQRTYELHQALEQMEAVSALDALTGVANRRRFEEVLKMEWGRAARSRKALSIALIDVDWLSNFNARYGHDKGDVYLCKLVRVLQSGVMRSSDLIARYRGGCFVLVAPDTDANGILSIANYLCQEVLELDLPHEDSPLGRISISVGVATSVKPEARKAEALLIRAQAALALAKSQGRNQVVEG